MSKILFTKQAEAIQLASKAIGSSFKLNFEEHDNI